MRVIMHVDLDAFFAAVEQRENPDLEGKPVVIGADPKQGIGRGVVSTCNYLAREYGIHSGMPISIAWRKCPGPPNGPCIYLSVNMDLYVKVSEQIMQILIKYADKMEIGGIDEAFLDVSSIGAFNKAKKLAITIKDEIRKKLNLTCSIGVAPNKLIAKIASDFKKPDGLTIVTPKEAVKFLHPLVVEKIPGIGPKSKTILNGIGIETIGDLAKLDENKLNGIFGRFGATLHDYARGIDKSELIEDYEMKSISREHTFQVDTNVLNDIESTLSELSADTHKQLIEEKKKFRTVTLKVRFTGFETHTTSATLTEPTDDRQMILRTVLHLLDKFLPLKRKIRLLGVRLSSLSD